MKDAAAGTDRAQTLRRIILEESFDSIREAVEKGRVNSLPEDLRMKLKITLRNLGLSDEEARAHMKEVFEIVRTFNTYMIAEVCKS